MDRVGFKCTILLFVFYLSHLLFVPFSLFLPSLWLIDLFSIYILSPFWLISYEFFLYYSNCFTYIYIYIVYIFITVYLPLLHVRTLQLYTSFLPAFVLLLVIHYTFVINVTMHCNWLFFLL